MRTINIAVVDSYYKERVETISIVEEYFKGSGMKANIEWFNSGRGLLSEVEENGRYDICIIEPMLPDLNGIRLVKELGRIHKKGVVVFISRTESYAFAAFEARIYDYMSKPVSKPRLFKTLDNAIQDIIKNMVTPVVELELQTGLIRVPVDSILYIDIVNRALCYHMEDGKLYFSKCLRGGFGAAVDQFLEQPWFVLSGVSHLVNVTCITMLQKSQAIMSNGEIVPITEASYKNVRKMWRETKL